MKKEYFAFLVVGLFIFGYVLDLISGPISLAIENPFAFLSAPVLSIYPLTAVSIGAKVLSIVITTILILSLINKQYVLKSIVSFVLAAILVLYSIQQFATGQAITPIQWTISFAFAGIGLLLPSVLYLLIGLFKRTKKALSDDNSDNPVLPKP
jgi:hypothetical protein